jgi:uncharacterized oxidoreductase
VIPPFGALLPFGEHKGFGLSLVAELLGGALTGGLTCRQPYDGRRRILNGMFSVLLDPAQLGTAQHFAAETQAYLEWLGGSPAADGEHGITLAGQPERAARQRAEHEGIGVDQATWSEIASAAEKLGLGRAELEQLAASPEQ